MERLSISSFLFLSFVCSIYGQVALPIIPVTNVSIVCNQGEVARSCQPCDGTCNNTHPLCPLYCLQGMHCHCITGYVRDTNGNCIPQQQCNQSINQTCSQNEQYTTCGTACEPTCKNPNPGVCTMQCITNVCQCKKGYVRNGQNGCVLPNQCPTTIPIQQTCQNPCTTSRCTNGSICQAVCPQSCTQNNTCSLQSRCIPNNIPTCANTTCPMQATNCVMQEVTCVRAPCYPVPNCVSSTHQCGQLQCSLPKRCVNNNCVYVPSVPEIPNNNNIEN